MSKLYFVQDFMSCIQYVRYQRSLLLNTISQENVTRCRFCLNSCANCRLCTIFRKKVSIKLKKCTNVIVQIYTNYLPIRQNVRIAMRLFCRKDRVDILIEHYKVKKKKNIHNNIYDIHLQTR